MSSSLKATLNGWHLWGLAVGLVISGEYFGWSYGWDKAGTLGFLVTSILIAVMYTTFIFSFTELTTSIPHAGGPFAYARRAFGSKAAYVAGFATLVEFVFAPPAIAMAIGAYLNVQFPTVDPKTFAMLSYLVFVALNIIGVRIAATFELFVTILAGCFVVAEVMRLVAESGQKPAVDLYGVSSVQEEVGLRGGTTSSYSVDPDVGICVEVFFSSDQPDVDKKLNGEISLGKGPVIPRGLNINPFVYNLLTATAGKEEIPIQLISLPRASGTDANVMQISRSGVATALVNLPLRYMHSPVEVVALSDLEQAAKLIVASLGGFVDRDALIPL